MKIILVIEDNPKAPNGVDISTMRILTEQELENAAVQKPTKASAMMLVIEKMINELNLNMTRSAAAETKPDSKEGKSCWH
jgi:hypothetical protein